MATFSDTIKLVLNLDVDKSASSSLKGLKSDIDNTDGAWGKLKTGASGAFNFVKENAAGFATAAAGAVTAFAVSSIGDFQKVAESAGKLRDAFGLSAASASRWVEVADDLGIGAGAVELSMKKMLQTAGATPEVFDQLGVAIVRAKDGSVDASATFLSVIDRLHGMTDPAERAAAAQKLLGKSWQDSAELIELGADGVKARLAEVSGSKILTDDQIGQSRKFRDAMDDLTDRLDKVKLSLAAGLIPALTNFASVAGAAIDAVSKLNQKMDDLKDVPVVGAAFKELADHLNPVGAAVDKVSAAVDFLTGAQDQNNAVMATAAQVAATESAMAAMSTEEKAAWRAELKRATEAVGGHNAALDDAAAAEKKTASETAKLEQATGRAEQAARNMTAAWAELTGKLDAEQAIANIASDFEDMKAKGAAAWSETAAGAATAQASQAAYAQSTRDAKQDVISLGQQIGLSIPQVKSMLLRIDDGDIASVERELQILTRNRTMSVSIETHGGTAFNSNNPYGLGKSAGGGDIAAGEATWVGDKFGINSPSAELFVPDVPGHIYNQSQIRRNAGGTPGGGTAAAQIVFAPHIEIKALATNTYEVQRMVAEALTGWIRMNGPGGFRRALGVT